MPDKIFVNKTEASLALNSLSDEFAVIKNPSYVHPPFELYPLAKKIFDPADSLEAVVMDMDGTTTTTEEICIHSLEYMIRKISARMDKKKWAGLDHAKDYPHIIGNSTTKHVEYLINAYSSSIIIDELRSSFIFAAIWTLLIGQDEGRKHDVTDNIISLGCKDILNENKFKKFLLNAPSDDELNIFVKACIAKYSQHISFNSSEQIVRAAIDIYYQRYHEILFGITKGNSNKLAKELLADKTKHLIEPLPGVGIFLALIKGLLGDEAVNLADLLIKQYYLKNPAASDKFNVTAVKKKLLRLSRLFLRSPLKVAVVTSSIQYEADIVLTEVFKVLQSEIKKWDISPERKKVILKKFSGYKTFYDGFVTASESNEIRLKPHRDLYSIALHKLSLQPDAFHKVIGFEDSESGTIAIRAAGIGRCVAVPFAQTSGHNLDAAAFNAPGGLAEIVLKHNLFVKFS